MKSDSSPNLDENVPNRHLRWQDGGAPAPSREELGLASLWVSPFSPTPVLPAWDSFAGLGGTTRARAKVHSNRLGDNGCGRFAGRISMQGALFARCPQFLERPVQVNG